MKYAVSEVIKQIRSMNLKGMNGPIAMVKPDPNEPDVRKREALGFLMMKEIVGYGLPYIDGIVVCVWDATKNTQDIVSVGEGGDTLTVGSLKFNRNDEVDDSLVNVVMGEPVSFISAAAEGLEEGSDDNETENVS